MSGWNNFVNGWGQFNQNFGNTVGIIGGAVNNLNKIEPITTKHEITTDKPMKNLAIIGVVGGLGLLALLLFNPFKRKRKWR